MAEELKSKEDFTVTVDAATNAEQPDAKSPETNAELVNEAISKGESVGETNAEERIEAEPAVDKATATKSDKRENHWPENDYEKSYKELYDYILEHFKSFSPSDEIAGRITEEHITEYLQSSREDKQHEYRERLTKRLLTAFELTAVLVCIILIVYFLKDNPAILVNILYIIGGLLALWIWKHPKKDEK